MSAYIIDTETTGEEPLPEVIELAIAKVETNLDYEAVFLGRFRPNGRIRFSAMAVHHILPDELAHEQPSVLAKAQLPTDMEYMVGHNVDYDWEALGRPLCKRICTLAISRYIWPGNDGHSLIALAYQLATDLREIRAAVQEAHSAGADVELCYGVLRAMLEQPQLQKHDVLGMRGWEALWQFSENARIPRVWSFGKHKGQDIAATERGYLSWCLRQPEFDPYVKQACSLAMRGQLLP